MSNVAVNESVLRWAIERSAINLSDLQTKFPKISLWLTGDSQPTLRQLEGFARATFTPLGFLFLKEPPEEKLPIPHFRTKREDRKNRPSPNLIETIHAMQLRQAWMREYLIEEGEAPLPFVKSVDMNMSPATIASRIRKTLGFTLEWAMDCATWTEALELLRDTIERTGVLVAVSGMVGINTHRKLNVDEFRGFVLVDDYAPLVFVNGADSKGAQMFTLAHEMAHVFLGSSAAFDLREMQPADNAIERICNQIAAEFLVPEISLEKAWPSIVDDHGIFDVLARRYKVSKLVIARRALDLSYLTKTEFLEFYYDYQNSEWHRASQTKGGNFYANQKFRLGLNFSTSVINAVREKKLLYSEAYRLTGLHGITFDKYISSIGLGQGK